MNAPLEPPAWAVWRDGIVFEKSFDEVADAEEYARHCNRAYRGSYRVKRMRDGDLEQVERLLADVEAARAFGSLTR